MPIYPLFLLLDILSDVPLRCDAELLKFIKFYLAILVYTSSNFKTTWTIFIDSMSISIRDFRNLDPSVCAQLLPTFETSNRKIDIFVVLIWVQWPLFVGYWIKFSSLLSCIVDMS